MQSGHFLQLLLTDDVETEAVMMSVLQNIIRVNSVVLMKTDEKTVHAILDELVYKLSSSTNPVIGIAATKAMILIANFHQSIVKSICNRYKGLRLLLSKQWTGKGFDRELGQLLDLLYSRIYQQNQSQRLHHAACVIQAAWKAFQTRKRIKRLPKAVSSLPKSFREKKERQLLLLERQRGEEELRRQLQLQRQRAIREFRQRKLDMLEIVPASLVEQERKAVVLIQKQWRGHKERKCFAGLTGGSESAQCLNHPEGLTGGSESAQCLNHPEGLTGWSESAQCLNHTEGLTGGREPAQCLNHTEVLTGGSESAQCLNHTEVLIGGSEPAQCLNHTEGLTGGSESAQCLNHTEGLTGGRESAQCLNHPEGLTGGSESAQCLNHTEGLTGGSEPAQCLNHTEELTGCESRRCAGYTLHSD
ncbi:IQ calmodulin-binding motif-containing protein 1 [Acipenser ruthenus]|uniref:IQ calmodulin-binding motif-containing protein 1 n=1 Tax=Acipenser ruthenus TaxID=7906 RepID=A0A662YPY6_ACIRT|nr:IQ calmodulin-binding motif-containing protein 1 [Acipenser ruthenus]